MECRQDDLGRRTFLGGVLVYRNSPAIIGHSDTAVLVDDDRDDRAVAGYSLID